MLDFSSFLPLATSAGLGGITGFLIGYAIKKIIKLAIILIGLSIVGLIYLQSQKILTVNWTQMENLSNNILLKVSNLTGVSDLKHINSTDLLINNTIENTHSQLVPALTNLGLPFTGSITAGLILGLVKG